MVAAAGDGGNEDPRPAAAAVLTDDQMSARLDKPNILYVSLSTVEDVKDALVQSEKAIAVFKKVV
jgi:phage tail sheath gpL-like